MAALPGGRFADYLEMMTGSVLDILIYVFDRYMLNETPEVPERENLARDLEHAGFAPDNVERALDWLTDLAFGHGQAQPAPVTHNGVRVFTDSELARLSTECRGLLLTLENARVLTPQQREIVIERMLALDADDGGAVAMERLAGEFRQVGFAVTLCPPPHDRWGKDWCERWRRLGPQSIWPLYEAFTQHCTAIDERKQP